MSEHSPSRRAFLKARFKRTSPIEIVQESCLAHQHVACELCRDSCGMGALRFLAGSSGPTLIAERCTGCGECLAMCPVNAIQLQPGNTSS